MEMEMKTSLAAAAFLSLCASGFSEMPLIPAEYADSALVAGNNAFALDLFGEVCSLQQEGNVFISPFSISMALGMTWNGASGETALDMASVLNFSMPVLFVNQAFQRVSEQVSSGDLQGAERGDSFTMTVSNGIWVQEGFELLDSFVSAVSGYYAAGVRNLDFTGDPEGSREIINEWVAENTLEKIIDLIPDGVLGADTRLVLTNAVYFKASWESPFNELATSEGRFVLSGGNAVTVPMMDQTEFFDYGSGEGWKAVSLDYTGRSVSMLIIVPDDMEEFQGGFDAAVLEGVIRRLSRVNLHLRMPRFEFTRSMPLGDILTALGMGSAFGSSANFSAITGNPDLFISQVLHQAYVKVDENGTEAAAATAVAMNITAIPSQPVEMTVDRPFIFLIRDTTTGSILFTGRVSDPSL